MPFSVEIGKQSQNIPQWVAAVYDAFMCLYLTQICLNSADILERTVQTGTMDAYHTPMCYNHAISLPLVPDPKWTYLDPSIAPRLRPSLGK